MLRKPFSRIWNISHTQTKAVIYLLTANKSCTTKFQCSFRLQIKYFLFINAWRCCGQLFDLDATQSCPSPVIFFNVSVTFQFKSLNFLLYRIFKKSTVHMRHRWWQILKTLISLLVSHHKLSMLFTLGTDTVGLLCLCEQILLILKHPPPPHTQIKLRSAINTRIQNRSVKYGIA